MSTLRVGRRRSPILPTLVIGACLCVLWDPLPVEVAGSFVFVTTGGLVGVGGIGLAVEAFPARPRWLDRLAPDTAPTGPDSCPPTVGVSGLTCGGLAGHR